MTERETVTEAAVEVGTKALLELIPGECIHARPNGCDLYLCKCRREVRAILSAALPLIVAGERERCALLPHEPPDTAECGRGRSGEPMTAKMFVWQILHGAMEEWDRQAASQYERPDGWSDIQWDAYLKQRLFHHLANLVSLYRKMLSNARADKGGE